MERRENVETEFIKCAEHAKISNMQKSLSKKAKELSILCGIEIAVIIFSIGGQPFFFSKPDVESVVHQFLESNQPSASSSSRYIMKKRKVEESENKGKVTEDPQFVLEMNDASSSTLPSNWLSL
ncbi:agamous-like MADS-box protein AGL29 [Lycium ferocissimum]|uniref:agamous-like MADS-box protein AGL29 n=1 Tax=Lycium ferocissimum TaxID=112874 RepID=UPI0028152189|nr:agamous-like MADS-box protein AGL29 [Lycium ferocissimum]